MPRVIKKTMSILFVWFAAFAFVACGDVNDKNELAIYICDSPADYSAVNFNISSVEVRSAGSDVWTHLVLENRYVPLMYLVNGKMQEMGRLVMSMGGQYDAVRFTFSTENANVTAGGENSVMAVDPADAVVVVEFPEITMNGPNTPLLFDIDAASSVVEENVVLEDGTAGIGYRLRPQITFIDSNAYGVVQGGLQESETTAVNSRIWMRFTNDLTGIVNSTYCSLSPVVGAFFIRLIPGDYTLEVIPSQKSELKNYTTKISVTRRGITDLGTITLGTTSVE